MIPSKNSSWNLKFNYNGKLFNKKPFEYYKSLGNKIFDVLTFDELQKEFAEDSNSIAIIVKHLVGNMLSLWTNFLMEDGVKEWWHRDMEFEPTYISKKELIQNWNQGWIVCLTLLNH